ncbi:unnamed protein product, partial [Rotaria socialis]
PPSSNNKTLPPQQALRNSTNMPK